jgi:WD40 repeat protein
MRGVLMNKLNIGIISVLVVGSLAGTALGFAANRPGRVGPAAASAERPGAQAVSAAPPGVQGARVTKTLPAVSRVLRVAEGEVTGVAFGPDGRIAAGYFVDSGGGVVVFDARGERVRPAPLEVKEGQVTSVAFGPEGRIAAGYFGLGAPGGGVVVFDARGERVRPAPLEVKEGQVMSVAFGPEGRIAASYSVIGAPGVGGGVVVFDAP